MCPKCPKFPMCPKCPKYFCNGKFKSHGRSESFIIAPPPPHTHTQRWGYVGLLLTAQCVLSVYLSHSFMPVYPGLSIVQAVKHETLIQCWANVGPLFTTLSQISPVLGYRVVFGNTLNVGQHHRQWANKNPAFGSKHHASTDSIPASIK